MCKRLLPLMLLTTLVPLVAHAAEGDAAWKQLLSLAGVWEGAEGGKSTTVTYTVISGGSALMESMKMPAPEPDMVTIYHRDGEGLVATHYCSMGNQPRMRAPGAAPDGKSIRFRFADITNLKPGGGHIKHLTVTFQDDNHFTPGMDELRRRQRTTGRVQVDPQAKEIGRYAVQLLTSITLAVQDTGPRT